MDIIGKYKIIKELGAGGFGAVYLAQDPRLGTRVAIKVFRVKDENMAGIATSASQDAGSVLKQRFLSEARTLEALSHNPYIVTLKEFDELADGTPYYVMPYLPRSLEQEMGKDAFTRGKLDETPKALHPRKLASGRALVILQQILQGMSAVHEAGLVHRDIKPANILFDASGNVQICDFGIAKLPDAEHSQSGVGMGSRNYMSPEQRESAKHVTPASDVYSIGVLAYRMLTGQLPSFPFEPVTAFSPGVGQAVSELTEQAIAQQEDKRPTDANRFLALLKKALTETGDTGEEDDATGTWVGETGTQVAAELKPIQEELENLLRAEGYVQESQLAGIHAMAMVAGLSDAELNTFIRQVEQALAEELKPYRNWLKLVERQAQQDQGELSAASKSVLLKAGSLVKRPEKALQDRLRAIYAQHKTETVATPVPEKPAKPVSNSRSPAAAMPRQNQSSTKFQAPANVQKSKHADASPGQPQAFNNPPVAKPPSTVKAPSATTQPEKSSDAFADKTYEVGGVRFVMKAIPGGRFMMGSDSTLEKPQHPVSITPFYLMETPCAFALIDQCIESGMPLAGPDDDDMGRENHPVINVSWNDITDTIIPWLNRHVPTAFGGFRLPTEAEWEYACRAGTDTRYSWGDVIDKTRARYDGGSNKKVLGLFNNKSYGTAPMKSYPANPFGLYDMHGNVWEWVQDCWHDAYEGAPNDGSAWMMTGVCDLAVLRGGFWNNKPINLRSASRGRNYRAERSSRIGFRLACDVN